MLHYTVVYTVVNSNRSRKLYNLQLKNTSLLKNPNRHLTTEGRHKTSICKRKKNLSNIYEAQ